VSVQKLFYILLCADTLNPSIGIVEIESFFLKIFKIFFILQKENVKDKRDLRDMMNNERYLKNEFSSERSILA
jgi:hypothetical protein